VRVFSYTGIEHKLSERNWKQMLRRFNADNAKINAFGYYVIPVKSICFSRAYKCIRCPLRDPHKKTNSCTYLFSKIIGDELLPSLHMRDSGILWEKKDDEKARTALKKVSDVLSASVRIDRAMVKRIVSKSNHST
jgi:hypothetical protein